jgi:hypothetical protein
MPHNRRPGAIYEMGDPKVCVLSAIAVRWGTATLEVSR